MKRLGTVAAVALLLSSVLPTMGVAHAAPCLPADCPRPSLKPDLAVAVHFQAPTLNNSYLTIQVTNNGAIAAPPSKLVITANGIPDQLRNVGTLAPNASQTLTFSAPGCPMVLHVNAVMADYLNTVIESNEANNLAANNGTGWNIWSCGLP